MKRGKFVTFEGCEGAGKSRQIQFVKELFAARGVDFILTREPGGPAISEKIRAFVLDVNNAEMTAECEALLYAAARAQHVKQLILPALESGKTVLCDRYIDSSLAYQGYARGLGMDYIRAINAAAAEALPDVTLFLDLPPAAAFARKGGADRGDRLDVSGMEFHEKVYAGYLEVCARFPERVVRIDCSGTKEETRAKIAAALQERGIC